MAKAYSLTKKKDKARNKIMKCIFCKGTGELENPKNFNPMQLKIIAAKALREKKFSIRQIMRIMNYKSPNTVTYLLNKK